MPAKALAGVKAAGGKLALKIMVDKAYLAQACQENILSRFGQIFEDGLGMDYIDVVNLLLAREPDYRPALEDKFRLVGRWIWLDLHELPWPIPVVYLILSGYKTVILGPEGISIRNFFFEKGLPLSQVKNILRETERITLMARRPVRVRMVSYYLELTGGRKLTLIKQIRENDIDKYDKSLENKLDLFLKLVASDYDWDFLFLDIDDQQEDDFNVKADYVKGLLGLDRTESPQLKQVQAQKKAKVRQDRQRLQRINFIIIIVICLFNITRIIIDRGLSSDLIVPLGILVMVILFLQR